MERNHLIGFILIFAILLTFTYINKPSEEVLAQRKRERDSIEMIKKNIQNPQAETPATLTQVNAEKGSLAELAMRKDSIITLENDDVKVRFSAKGGKIASVEMKKHFKTSNDSLNTKSNVLLQEDPKNVFNLSIPVNGKTINTNDLFFTPVVNGNKIDFTLKVDSSSTIIQTYNLASSGYAIDYSVSAPSSTSGDAKLEWINYIDKIEKGYRYEQSMVSIYYKEMNEDDPDYCSCTGNDNKILKDNKISWVSNTNQFFNSSLISKSGGFMNADLTTEVYDFNTNSDLKKLTSKISIPLQGGSHNMQWYIGPNDFNTLKSYNLGLENLIPYGSSIFGSLNRWVIRPFFEFLNKFISSKGIVIILLIFLIKMLLYPLLYKTLLSQAKMSALKPELNKIKEKYKDDMQKQQVESMQVYQEFGVSPFSGCMPMFLQMPIWIALYRFFPSNITFRGESFLWANDLSSFDNFLNLGFELPFMGSHISLFTLLWAVSTLIYTYYSTKDVDMSANPAMKYVQYIMPLMFLGFFNSYASGLTCYMFFSNLINILQTIFTRKFLFDEVKIRKQLEEVKKNPKKKSGFMARMEEAVKMQQKLAEQKAKQSKK